MDISLIWRCTLLPVLLLGVAQDIPWRRLRHRAVDASTPGAIHVLSEGNTYFHGVAVIQNSARWAAVWHNSLGSGAVPHVDFTRETLAAISYGAQSGCFAPTNHVVRVVAGKGDTVWVEARPDPYVELGPKCDGVYTIADLVVIERPHANVQWRRAKGPRRANERPLPTNPLWDLVVPSA